MSRQHAHTTPWYCVVCGFLYPPRFQSYSREPWTHHDGTRGIMGEPGWCRSRARNQVSCDLGLAIYAAVVIGGHHAGQILVDEALGTSAKRNPYRITQSKHRFNLPGTKTLIVDDPWSTDHPPITPALVVEWFENTKLRSR